MITDDRPALFEGQSSVIMVAAPMGWREKSEIGPAASPAMILKTFQSYSLKSLQDHGNTVAGGWQNKSPNTGPTGQANHLVIEWTVGLSRANFTPQVKLVPGDLMVAIRSGPGCAGVGLKLAFEEAYSRECR